MSRGKCPVCRQMIKLTLQGEFSQHMDYTAEAMGRICSGSGQKKVVKGFMDGYKTYDPAVEGHGNARDWSSSFYTRMGQEEAEEIIAAQDDTPRGLLGVGPKATWDEIKKAFRAKAMACHPDLCSQHGLTPEVATARFKKLTAAFTVLERQFGK